MQIWVVLSVCKTAAGEKPGAEALSGLALRYSKPKHVRSSSRTGRWTWTFDALTKDPAIDRAEALRHAM